MSVELASTPGGTSVVHAAPLARVLCVDDEPRVLEGIALNLRKRYEVLTASSGAAALDILSQAPPVAVILCDMRMPGMDGNQFLQVARQIAPGTVRVLLTGQADLKAALAAVNEGQVFRFLTKPCPPTVLLPTLEAAVEHHRRQIAEKLLLEQTLHGAIKALGDVLALTSPIAFGRATRVGGYVASVARTLQLEDVWSLEVAAMVSQLGFITLPADLVERVHRGQPITAQEAEQVKQVPSVTERLLASIPRLDGVRKILSASVRPIRRLPDGADARSVQNMWAAHALCAAVDYDDLAARGHDGHAVIAALRAKDVYASEVIDALADCVLPPVEPDREEQVPLNALRVGMIVADNVYMSSGTLLVARGYEITQSFLGRVRNLRAGAVCEPLSVIIKGTPRPAPPEIPI